MENIPVYLEMPGGDEFTDVTQVLVQGAQELRQGELIFMSGFDLTDAMSALEIGEPRMDSGVVLPDEVTKPLFDPLAPLLPEEMAWHSGTTLSQTIYTCLYVHNLEDLDPECLPLELVLQEDPARPWSLVTFVLRAGVVGLIKCVDLAWRELSKGRVLDQEDWQGEKCEISLLEGTPWRRVLSLVEETSDWILGSPFLHARWRTSLHMRLQLRKIMLQLLGLSLPGDRTQLENLVVSARSLLQQIRANPSPEPGETSAALQAFDPRVMRHLHSYVPLRPLQLPSQESTWDALEALIDGYEEMLRMAKVELLATWQLVGHLNMWQNIPERRIPYLRSMMQSLFFDDVLVLLHHPPQWLVNSFFKESIGLEWSSVCRVLRQRWRGEGDVPIGEIDRRLTKLLARDTRSLWSNPPRHRRYQMKSLLDWQILFDLLVRVTQQLHLSDEPGAPLIRSLPVVVLCKRLANIREVVLSGFQLELYSVEEKPLAYWYASQAIEAHATCLESLLKVMPDGTPERADMDVHLKFLRALFCMCKGMLIILLLAQTRRPDWERLRLNFLRRNKWAYRPEYSDATTNPVAQPCFDLYPKACHEALQEVDSGATPTHLFQQAREILQGIADMPSPIGWASQWSSEFAQFISRLKDTSICAEPSKLERLEDTGVGVLKWDVSTNPWFPRI
ncbi:hypothetical protein PUNSTDRAFT_135491 [Punctularia strigosozonata HHB-11173 SS5]|uniref:uncharacterized protein n=1 Tax=Punctularia strigosozonata (strain HHB-11173) TaxID=741275 RepID=UPI000441813E|nr:uncharacterized protein PUNSTDRAFT_135491 [Punctularia strigosozonata HHB-11173 SS5]EIN07974.1 hypothetical protein PUNSTDRAFT_135491 [Punctularia strigosozonata HHB-11173 SS5]